MSVPTLNRTARRRRRLRPEEKIAQSLRVLKLLREAEWMVSCDWCQPSERHTILEGVDEILSSDWAQKILEANK